MRDLEEKLLTKMKIEELRICKYRNCTNVIEGRINKLYCNRKCKSNESKYISRSNKGTDK